MAHPPAAGEFDGHRRHRHHRDRVAQDDGQDLQPQQSSGTDQTQAGAPPPLFYRVKVAPEQTWLETEGERRIMRSGMTVSVDIETGRRRVLDFFLDPIVKYLNDGMAVR